MRLFKLKQTDIANSMKSGDPFFNLLFKDEADFSLKAKYKILFTFFVLAFIKGIIAIGTAIYFDQHFQMLRAFIFIGVYTVLFYAFIKKIIPLKTVAHIAITGCLILIYTNLFLTTKSVNIITLQFTFIVIISGFYILGTYFGTFYSVLSIIPVLASLSLRYKFSYSTGMGALASPGYELIVLVNFITIIYIPYLFYQAFISTLKEKEGLNIQLQTAVKIANEAVKSKSEFLSTMSHELRTPLNTVIGTTDLLLSDAYDPHQVENLKDLKFSANYLLDIVNDILDYNKLESSKLKLETINVDLVKLLNEVSSGLYHQAHKKHIELKLEVDEEINNYSVFTDPTRITQILYNLIGNAIKFTSVGEVTVKLNILEKGVDNLLIRFTVKDTGIGISQDQQVSIFEPFNQASTSITRNFGGTGLGLSIVKRLLLLFGSNINLESRKHQGATFYFDIDFKYQLKPEQKDSELVSEEIILNQDISDLNILVAEDNLMNRVLIQKVFSRWKNTPVFAENGQQAIDIAAKTKFDLILMDLHMPVMDGYRASKTIKYDKNNINYSTPIIAFTASISEEILAEVKSAGMSDCIYKPFNATEMYDKMRNFC